MDTSFRGLVVHAVGGQLLDLQFKRCAYRRQVTSTTMGKLSGPREARLAILPFAHLLGLWPECLALEAAL